MTTRPMGLPRTARWRRAALKRWRQLSLALADRGIRRPLRGGLAWAGLIFLTAVAMLILTAMYGASLDRMPVTRVMTLGGHHVLVMALAVVAIVILVGLAWPTEGFTEATPRQRVALVLAGALAAVSAIGTVGFVLAAVSVAFLLLALMSRV